jgi:hypothetical protein
MRPRRCSLIILIFRSCMWLPCLPGFTTTNYSKAQETALLELRYTDNLTFVSIWCGIPASPIIPASILLTVFEQFS